MTVTDEESSLVKYLRSQYQAISQRTFTRDIIVNVAIEVNAALPRVFPQLERRRFSRRLQRLREVGEMDDVLFVKLDAIRIIRNKIIYEGYAPDEYEAKAALKIFESFIEWVKRVEGAEPSARITYVGYEFDIWDDDEDEEGMEIYIDFEVDHFFDRTGEVIANFYYDNGEPLVDSHNNELAVWEEFTPQLAFECWEGFSLFLPYDWLEDALGEGEHDLKFDVWILDDHRKKLAKSDWYYFSFSV
jgi:hypothetical protein